MPAYEMSAYTERNDACILNEMCALCDLPINFIPAYIEQKYKLLSLLVSMKAASSGNHYLLHVI